MRDIRTVGSEPMGLTQAAMDAVKQWRFEPARTASGKPVEVYTTVTISFLLDRATQEKPKRY